jgi:hypothetical protein
MMRHLVRITLVTLALTLAADAAFAQYRYPPGYGGWGGWGGPATVGGSHAAGMGVFAAGAGAYNEQTAEARSMNAQTAMQANEYMYQSQQRRNATYQKKLAQEKQLNEETVQTNYNRIHNNPNEYDIHQGDALNVAFDELKNPKVFGAVLQEASSQPIPSELVKNVAFQYACQAITISLEDLTAQGAPDVLLTDPAYESERKTLRSLAAKARQEADNQGKVNPETAAQMRVAIKSAIKKVAANVPNGTPDRRACDNYLKALYGLTKMMETPNISEFLRGLNKVETTTLAHLLNFMHSFNLRFGAAQNPMQENAYDQLYPLLVALRNQSVPQGSAPTSPLQVPPPPDPQKLMTHFSGMAYSHFEPQPAPNAGQAPPPPPAPGTPR